MNEDSGNRRPIMLEVTPATPPSSSVDTPKPSSEGGQTKPEKANTEKAKPTEQPNPGIMTSFF